MRTLIDPTAQKIGIFCLLFLVLTAPTYLVTRSSFHFFMLWNLFLSLVPLGFALLFRRSADQSKKWLAVLWALLWLLFFPNAPYMITDLLHISAAKFYVPETKYTTDISTWVWMLHLAVVVLLGLLSGLYSLYIIHKAFLKRKRKLLSGVFLAVVGVLSGYAIYIGRFLRVNSWDILHPVSLFSKLLSGITGFSVIFSLLMAGCLLFLYWIFYWLFQKPEIPEIKE